MNQTKAILEMISSSSALLYSPWQWPVTLLSRSSLCWKRAFHSQSRAFDRQHVTFKHISVSADESDMRLDRFLVYRILLEHPSIGLSHLTINKLLRKRQVKLLNDKSEPEKGSTNQDLHSTGQTTVTLGATRIKEGQVWRVRMLLPASEESSGIGSTTEARHDGGVSKKSVQNDTTANSKRANKVKDLLPLKDWIVYKDKRMVVLDKPAGIAVQGGTKVIQSIDDSLSVLQEDYPEEPRIVHRLDKTTSGLLILARTRKAAQDLSKRFHDGSTSQGQPSLVDKKYLAIVGSEKPLKTTSGGILNAKMTLSCEGKTDRIRIVEPDADQQPKNSWLSTTEYKILSQSIYSGVYWSLLQLHPRTGRKHQLRVHCAELLQAPILGDSKYATGTPLSSTRIHLHMAELQIKKWFDNNQSLPKAFKSDTQQPFSVLSDGTLVIRSKIPQETRMELERLGLKKPS